MGICCSRKECVIFENNILNVNNKNINDSLDDTIIEVFSNNNKIILKEDIEIENNKENSHSKIIQGPIFRLLLKKNLIKNDSPKDEMNGSTNIIKI